MTSTGGAQPVVPGDTVVLRPWEPADADAVFADVEPANVGSVRVAEAGGFTREGVLRQRLVLRGRRVDVAMYSLLPGDAVAAGSPQESVAEASSIGRAPRTDWAAPEPTPSADPPVAVPSSDPEP